jgi:lysozyme family protein
MALEEQLRKEITASLKTLQRRLASTADDAEKTVLMRASRQLDDARSGFGRASALEVANAIADAIDALVSTVGAVKMGPFNGHLSALEGHLTRLNMMSGKVHASESLAGAAETKNKKPKKVKKAKRKARHKARRKAPRPSGAVAGLESVAVAPPAAAAALLTSTAFADLRDEYQRLYDRCELKPGSEGNVAFYLKRLRQGQPNYQLVEDQIKVPWVFVGIIHGMECGFNFAGHLHNGDPLTARTVQVPKGRPVAGNPPFTWLDSALDALRLKKMDLVTDWSVPHMLYLLEGYNGYGYRKRGLPSPYLWSFSNNYEKGKFVADGHYDPEAVSKQCGAALMMKAILQ